MLPALNLRVREEGQLTHTHARAHARVLHPPLPCSLPTFFHHATTGCTAAATAASRRQFCCVRLSVKLDWPWSSRRSAAEGGRAGAERVACHLREGRGGTGACRCAHGGG